MARAKKTDQEKSAGKNNKNAVKKPQTEEQTTGAAPEQEAPEQTQDTAPEQEAPEQTQDTAPEQEPPKEQETPEPDMFAKLPDPCVYCGPSVKGIARQYTTYQGGIHDALREFIKARPEALGLIVSTGKFPAMRKRLETHGTREAKLYKAVKERL